MGKATSGHGYDAFIRQFPTFFPRPPASNPDGPIPGFICQDFGVVLRDLGYIPEPRTGYIYNVHACDEPTAACPDEPYSGAPGTCTVYPNDGNVFYCDTGLQVRLRASGPDPVGELERTGYCIPESLGAPELSGGCAVDPAHYALVGCPWGPGLLFDWVDSQDHRVLVGK